MDDGFLIRQTLSGKPNAFRLLVVRYQRPLFRFLGGFGLDQAVAEELAQETFLRAYRNLAGYERTRRSSRPGCSRLPSTLQSTKRHASATRVSPR